MQMQTENNGVGDYLKLGLGVVFAIVCPPVGIPVFVFLLLGFCAKGALHESTKPTPAQQAQADALRARA